ncbi:hypothetical protein M231_00866 [Tremella mesenterica]|uniref:Uncharacterized protein n=1 Tax=Tremella mesenterica TaxID=5217 RepID=A0A4V1M4X3_TREME|nr:hypothetical protein M231_00866 [Tremella mesenterica]
MSFQVQLTSPPSVTSLSELLRTIRSCFNALEPSISQLITEYFSPPQSHELPVLSRQIEDYLDELNNEVRLLTHATSNWKDWRTKGMSNWKSLSQERPTLKYAPRKGREWAKEQQEFWQVCEKGRQNLISASTRYTDLEGRVMGMIQTKEGRVGNPYGPDVKVRGEDLSTFTAYDPFYITDTERLPLQGDEEEDTIVVYQPMYEAEERNQGDYIQHEAERSHADTGFDSQYCTSSSETVEKVEVSTKNIYGDTFTHARGKGMKGESIQGHYIYGPYTTSRTQMYLTGQEIVDPEDDDEDEEESEVDEEESDYEATEDDEDDEDDLVKVNERGWDDGLWYKGEKNLEGKTRLGHSYR